MPLHDQPSYYVRMSEIHRQMLVTALSNAPLNIFEKVKERFPGVDINDIAVTLFNEFNDLPEKEMAAPEEIHHIGGR